MKFRIFNEISLASFFLEHSRAHTVESELSKIEITSWPKFQHFVLRDQVEGTNEELEGV